MLSQFSLTLVPESDKIAVMKNFLRLLSLLLIILSTTACATTQGSASAFDGAEGTSLQSGSGSNKEKKQKQKKLLFEDWEYKGFGQPLPDWFEAAYKGDLEEVRRKIAVSDDYEIKIVTAQGINSDQANKSLWQKLVVKAELFELHDSSWVMLNEKEAAEKNNSYPYFAAAVILINTKEE